MRRSILLCLAAAAALNGQPYTRGIGVYPGDPREDSSPSMKTDAAAYRNLALHRSAYHSSSYDYNLTANLTTDGIVETEEPRRIVVSTSDAGVLPKPQREGALDDTDRIGLSLRGEKGWIQIQIEGPEAPEVDATELLVRLQGQPPQSGAQPQGGGGRPQTPPFAGEWMWTVSGSEDGQSWRELGRAAGKGSPPSVPVAFSGPAHSRFYRVEFSAPGAGSARISDINLFRDRRRVRVAGPYRFSSAWMSEGSGEEWVYVDLGAPCAFDRVALYWIRRPAEASLQVSDDAANWTSLQALPPSSGQKDEIKLASPAKGRYVRVLMTRAASPEGYILSEMEVYGRGGPVARPKPAPLPAADGRLNLAGGDWRLQRDSLVSAGGAAISKVGFAPTGWVAATVPGTVLFSYINLGAVPDPNYGENEVMISDSFFYADFWYRREFTIPAASKGKRFWLNFDGVNWKADVFVNGSNVGRLEGAFVRGRFDITGVIRPGPNALAVRVIKNDTPGSVKEKGRGPSPTGGPLGIDNPTFHASAGWDWISTIRGRDTGIWSNVYLTQNGPVVIEDPRVDTALPLPDVSRADVTVETTLRNAETAEVKGTLQVRFGPAVAELPVAIPANSAKTVKLDPSSYPQLRLAKPRLWWPNGYGEPNLYPVELTFSTSDKAVSDRKTLQAGVRQFTYSDDGGILKIWINGRRFIARGGNWGFSESTLRYRAREYDAAVRYHQHLNFNMIRNWVGMTGEEAFYEACDRYGIAVWQDFWLANPVDGPNPADNDLFLRNAADYIRRIRNHPSVALYCGRNEGDPPKVLDDGLLALVAGLHPGHRYISNSLRPLVSGGGPYRVEPQRYYFTREFTKLHSEMGAPHVPALESVRLMMPEKDLWPLGRLWQLHDFFDVHGQFPASVNGYGGADDLKEWMELAQFVDYDTYRGMFEGQSQRRMGLLIWMSHPAWPSILWQTYDYYLNPDGGYFGARKGSEPLHIQWNPVAETLEVVNYSAGEARGLTAKAEVLNLDGSVQWEKSASVDSLEDSTLSPIKLEYPLGVTPVHFIRLALSRQGRLLSTNFYLRPIKEGEYGAISQLPKADLEASTRRERGASRWVLTTELRNASSRPALMVRVKAVREKTGDRILPAIYSDNYVPLMPGEKISFTTELKDADTRGEPPRIVVEGFNLGRVIER